MGGELQRKSMLALAVPMIRAVNGVADVKCHRVSYAVDDTRPHPSRI